MGAEAPVVRDLRGWYWIKKWRQTLGIARTNVRCDLDAAGRRAVRRSALRGVREPVFLLGCPRSGTTFLGKVLEALPGASYYFEPPLLKYYSRLVYEGRVSEAESTRFYRRACRALLLAAPGNGPRLIEKNPKHTWVAERLRAAFPDAKFVVIARDGRDVAQSLFEKPWHRAESAALGQREPGEYLYGPFPHFYIEPERREEYLATSDLHRCCWIWRRYAEECERLRSVLPDAVRHDLRYEDLIGDARGSIDALLDFLGVEDGAARAPVHAAAAKGHASSIGRWRQSFTPEDEALVRAEAGELLDRLGYA